MTFTLPCPVARQRNALPSAMVHRYQSLFLISRKHHFPCRCSQKPFGVLLLTTGAASSGAACFLLFAFFLLFSFFLPALSRSLCFFLLSLSFFAAFRTLASAAAIADCSASRAEAAGSNSGPGTLGR